MGGTLQKPWQLLPNKPSGRVLPLQPLRKRVKHEIVCRPLGSRQLLSGISLVYQSYLISLQSNLLLKAFSNCATTLLQNKSKYFLIYLPVPLAVSKRILSLYSQAHLFIPPLTSCVWGSHQTANNCSIPALIALLSMFASSLIYLSSAHPAFASANTWAYIFLPPCTCTEFNPTLMAFVHLIMLWMVRSLCFYILSYLKARIVLCLFLCLLHRT